MRLARWRSPTASGLYLLVPLLLGVLLFSPLFARGVPNTADGLLHLFRTALWSDAWAHGILWPRWHTLLYQGYGYPLFNFYAPLLYVVGSTVSLITGSADSGLKAALFLTCLAYPLGMYLWTRDLFGRLCAVAAAAAYTFAAFRFRELYLQGNCAQFAAWAIYPWLFFTWRRLAIAPSRGAFLAAVFALVALLLTHNISAMLVAPALVAYVLWQAIENRASRPWLRLGLAGVCGLMIGMVFWLPALAESSLTRVHVLTHGYFDVVGHFITPGEIAAAMPRVDERAANPTMPYNVGRLQMLLALIGALSLFRRRTSRLERGHLIFATLGALTAAFLMIEPSLVVWRTVPYIAFAEFPTRLYGVGFVFSALLAGASLRWLADHKRWQALAALIVVFGLILEVANYQFPRTFIPVRASVEGFRAYEAGYNALGTTSASEYLSRWTTEIPRQPALPMEGNRLALVDAPPGVSASVETVTPEQLVVKAIAPAPVQVALAQFYFPGWVAQVDGAPVTITPCTPNGLICLTVPAGDSVIDVRYVGTLVQHTGALLGWVGLALTVLATLLPSIRGAAKKREGVDGAPEVRMPTSDGVRERAPAWALITLLSVIVVAKIAWIAPYTRLYRLASPPDRVLPAQHEANLPVGPSMRLVGWDLPATTVSPGDRLSLRLYWQANAPLSEEYSSFAQLIGGPQQQEYAGSAVMHPGNMPTTAWNPDYYVVDDQEIEIPADAPPILYTVRVGMSPRGSQERIGEQDLSPQVRVRQAQAVTAASVPHRLNLEFEGGVELVGYEIGPVGIGADGGSAGEPVLPITLYWRATTEQRGSPQIFAHVVDATGALLAQSDGAAYGGLYPVADWLPDEIVRDERRIPLPQDAQPAGIQVGLYDLSTLQRMAALPAPGVTVTDDAALIPLTSTP